MAYGRRLKPRIYPCLIQHLIHRGESSVVTVDSGNSDFGVNASSHILRAFDGQPSVRCVFDSDGEAAAAKIVVKIDLKHSAYNFDYVAILNHNLKTANGVFTILTSDTDSFGGATSPYLNDIVGDTTASGASATAVFNTNGSNILSMTQTSHRYVWLVFYGYTGGWADDLEIGDIMLGKHCTAPHGPDIGMKTGILHNGGKLMESYGGARHYMSGWTTGSDGQSLPFGPPFKTNNIASTNYIEAAIHPGRRYWEFTLSYLADTAVNQEDMSTGVVNPTTFTNVYAMTAGPALPFIFAPDSTSTTVGDYAFARFADDDYQQEEVAFGVVTLNRRIEEEF
jgi:hypothetical protein